MRSFNVLHVKTLLAALLALVFSYMTWTSETPLVVSLFYYFFILGYALVRRASCFLISLLFFSLLKFTGNPHFSKWKDTDDDGAGSNFRGWLFALPMSFALFAFEFVGSETFSDGPLWMSILDVALFWLVLVAAESTWDLVLLVLEKRAERAGRRERFLF